MAPKRVKIIRDELVAMGVDLSQVRWTGALRCHSAMRHIGESIEEQKTAIEINRIVKGCREHLLAEIKECQPKVVLLVGNIALKTAFNRKSGMDKYKGSIFQEGDITYLVTKDPLHIPKKSRAEAEFLASLKKVKACLTGKLEGDGKYMMPKTTAELQAARKILMSQDVLTFDFEIAMSLSKGVRDTDKLLGCGFSWEAGKAIYIPLDHKDSPFNGTQEAHDVVKEVLAAKGIKKIAHNGYFDCHAAKVFYKELPANFHFDTMLAHHLLDPTTGTHGLKYLAGMHTDLGGYEEKISAILDKLPKAERNYGVLPLDMIAKYCCIDADVTFRLYGRFKFELEEMNLTGFFEKITMPTIMTLIDMRVRGFNLDLGKLDMLIDLYEKEVVSTLKEVIACPKVQETNAELNVNSPKQIAKLLFEVYKLPVLKKTASGAPAADMATLLRAASTIKDEGEVSTFINAYLAHKKAKKTLATYLISMREKAHKTEDGIRIYTDYRPLTETGRLMCVKGDTLVQTRKGLVEMQDVRVGDEVATHKGRYRKVLKEIFKGYDTMVTITMDNGESLTCTPSHKLLLKDGSWKTVEEIENVSIENVGEEPREYTEDFGVVLRHGLGANSSEGGRGAGDIIPQRRGSGQGESIPEATKGRTGQQVLSFQNRKQKPNDSKERTATSQLEGGLRRRLRIQDEEGRTEEVLRTSDSLCGTRIEDSSGTTIGDSTRTPHRRRHAEQSSRQLSGCNHQGAQGYPPLAGRNNKDSVRIESISVAGTYGVYDITVEEDHSYLAAGIYSHNSSSPNLQNLPADHDKKHKVKDIFTAPKGYQFMEMDFSQIELRNLANTTRDEQLVGAYLNGEDLHTKTAQLLFQRDEVTSGERKLGKTINFASVYGAGPWRLAETITTGNLLDGPETLAMVMDTLGLDAKQAKTRISRNLNAALADVGEVLLDRFFSSYPAVSSWQTKIESYVAKHEHLRTPFGRIRYIETRTKRGAKYTAQWQNIARNTPIQSVSSDCLLLSLVACNDLLKARGAKTKVVGTVHDSILFYIHEDEMDLLPIIKKEMEIAPTRFMPDFFVVPLVADIQIGPSWGKIVPLELDDTATSVL